MSRLPKLLEHRRGDTTPLEMFDEAVAVLGDGPLLIGPSGTLGATDVDRLVASLAEALAGFGVQAGDRVALHLQNDPQFVVGMLAAWRLGAIAVPCSPMLRGRELAVQLRDAGPVALIALDELYRDVSEAVGDSVVRVVITTGRDDLYDGVEIASTTVPSAGTHSFRELVRTACERALRPPPLPDDIAVLTYTSGTTGPAKGAMNTHANVAQAARIYRDCLQVGPDDVILGIAPLYHVTGLTAHIGLSRSADPGPPVRCRRVLPVDRATPRDGHGGGDHRVRGDRESRSGSGARPLLAPARLQRRSPDRSGHGPRHPVPNRPADPARVRPDRDDRPDPPVPARSRRPGARPDRGARSGLGGARDRGSNRGRARTPTSARRSRRGRHSRTAGRQRYWMRPEETAHALPDGELLTGDVGLTDRHGWLYLVDRRKDLIIASGFKVWPREVEDVLYEHDAVREAAVIGVPDSYRGETVWAYVSLQAGSEASEAELITHCRDRLASYKYPRAVRILPELPKTHSGKILRRDLRKLAEAG